jgi:hypothetical protein
LVRRNRSYDAGRKRVVEVVRRDADVRRGTHLELGPIRCISFRPSFTDGATFFVKVECRNAGPKM